MKYLYVPEELIPALQAAGVSVDQESSLEVLTDIVRMKDILSPEDVAFYWYANSQQVKALPDAIRESMSPALTAVHYPPSVHPDTDPALRKCIETFQSYTLANKAPEMNMDGKHLLFALLGEDTIIFTHNQTEHQTVTDTYDKVIHLIHSVIPFEKLAGLPLFRQFLLHKVAAN